MANRGNAMKKPYIEVRLNYTTNLESYPGIENQRDAMEFDLEQVRDGHVSLAELIDFSGPDDEVEFRVVSDG